MAKFKLTGCAEIDAYATAALASTRTGRRLKKGIAYIGGVLDDPDVFIDTARIGQAIRLIESRFGYALFPWEKFVIALSLCFYRSSDTVVFREYLIVMGRGNGKNGFISGLAWYFTTKAHGVKGYNVDIIANSEEQAKTSFEDVYEMLEEDAATRRYYDLTKVLIRNRSTKSYIKYNTSNAKTKDGKRSACLIFDEVHEYENADQIKVFSSGFGKRKHSRKYKITTRGYVMDGVLDDDLRIADDVLSGKIKGIQLCPLIYEVDSEADVQNPDMWEKANPSLPYLPELKKELDAAFIEAKYKSETEQDFYTKRMNLPKVDRELNVATRAQLMAASRDVPDLTGCACIAGIDYALLSDMAAAGLLFRIGDERYWIGHAWICKQSADWNRIRAPLEEWAAQGLLTIIEGPQIDPDQITGWLQEQGQKYSILKVSLDNARFALMREALADLGYSYEQKTINLVRPLGIVSAAPVIESWFVTEHIAWGDNPLMRWATNNTKKVRMKAERASGNYKYEKKEPRSRKTDPFMALVHAAVLEGDLAAQDENFVWEMPDTLI